MRLTCCNYPPIGLGNARFSTIFVITLSSYNNVHVVASEAERRVGSAQPVRDVRPSRLQRQHQAELEQLAENGVKPWEEGLYEGMDFDDGEPDVA